MRTYVTRTVYCTVLRQILTVSWSVTQSVDSFVVSPVPSYRNNATRNSCSADGQPAWAVGHYNATACDYRPIYVYMSKLWNYDQVFPQLRNLHWVRLPDRHVSTRSADIPLSTNTDSRRCFAIAAICVQRHLSPTASFQTPLTQQ